MGADGGAGLEGDGRDVLESGIDRCGGEGDPPARAWVDVSGADHEAAPWREGTAGGVEGAGVVEHGDGDGQFWEGADVGVERCEGEVMRDEWVAAFEGGAAGEDVGACERAGAVALGG
jgi:hypothetical protein